jgi:spore germination cell wall hydrolase CwlJ-like protein
MVKTVRVFLALFATLWYTTSPINSNAPSHIWEYDIDRILNQKPVSMVAPDYYKPLEFDKVKYTAADVLCLAKNIYFEAGVESTAGKLAVANVTLNRTLGANYPNSICEVVHEGIHRYNARIEEYVPVRDRCQFSWYCDGLLDDPREGRTWESAQELAKRVLVNHYDRALIDITDGATHYHANWMEKYPKWSKKKKVMASIDRHIFYGSKKL